MEDINLTIRNGDYISIVGENGSGKSTLVRLLLGLLSPVRGRIIRDFSRIAYVPQRFETLNSQFPITVGEVLNCYRKVLKIKEKNCVGRYLDLVKMGGFRESLMGNLSGGQCQKVLIARALMLLPVGAYFPASRI